MAWKPTASERAALDSLPARLEPSDLSVHDHARIRFTKQPDVLLVPLPLWVLFASWMAFAVITTVELAGTSSYVTPFVIAIGLLVVLISGWTASDVTSKTWSRALMIALAPALAYFFGLWQARAAPGPLPWPSFVLLLIGASVYVGIALALYLWLRRSQIAGRTLLAVSALIAAAVGATNWFSQILTTQFEQGLGLAQARIPLSTLDLLLMRRSHSALATVVALLLVFGLAWFHTQVQERRIGAVLLMVPSLVALLLTYALPLLIDVAATGAQIRAGDLTHAGSIASCVQLGEMRHGPLPVSWSHPGILVGPMTGPAVFIDVTSAAHPLPATVLSEGITTRALDRSSCEPPRP